jgi:hypothetical protein
VVSAPKPSNFGSRIFDPPDELDELLEEELVEEFDDELEELLEDELELLLEEELLDELELLELLGSLVLPPQAAKPKANIPTMVLCNLFICLSAVIVL